MKGIKKVRVILVLMFLAGILSPVFSQQRTITGTVFDEAGQAMPGGNVIVKGTSTGASTDADGRFSIAIPPDSDVLTFSFIGFRPAELKLEGRIWRTAKKLKLLFSICYGFGCAFLNRQVGVSQKFYKKI